VLRDARVAEDGAIEVDITPTYSGCPAMRMIALEVEMALRGAGFSEPRVREVLAPAWTTDWMSEAGRAIMKEAMMAGGDRRAERAKVEAARERMLAALDADRLDTGAVKRAMDEERALAEATRQERQAAMLAAFGKLSTVDRKAFVADSRAMKNRMDKRMQGWRERLRDRRSAPLAPPSAPQEPAPTGMDSEI
jgi:metal-sulfur cluster biosynthetic enzyme